MNKAELDPYADGCWLPTQSDDFRFNPTDTNFYTPIIHSSLLRNNERADRNFFIPIWMLFPSLRSIPDMSLYTSNG